MMSEVKVESEDIFIDMTMTSFVHLLLCICTQQLCEIWWVAYKQLTR